MVQIEMKQANVIPTVLFVPMGSRHWSRGRLSVCGVRYQPSPPMMSSRLSPWRRVVERLIGRLTSGASVPPGPAVPLSGTDGECVAERNTFI